MYIPYALGYLKVFNPITYICYFNQLFKKPNDKSLKTTDKSVRKLPLPFVY